MAKKPMMYKDPMMKKDKAKDKDYGSYRCSEKTTTSSSSCYTKKDEKINI
jgi:hypothetical protein